MKIKITCLHDLSLFKQSNLDDIINLTRGTCPVPCSLAVKKFPCDCSRKKS